LEPISGVRNSSFCYQNLTLAAYTANPSLIYYTAAKQILRYLKGTINFGLTYRDSPSSNIFLAGDAAITWESWKQTMITLLSTEAEYIALSESSREIMWLRHLYGELEYIQKEPILLLGDNNGLIAMA
jgi:hypothetical protein